MKHAVLLLCAGVIASPAFAQAPAKPTDDDVLSAALLCEAHNTGPSRLGLYDKGWEHCRELRPAADAVRAKRAGDDDAAKAKTKAVTDGLKSKGRQ